MAHTRVAACTHTRVANGAHVCMHMQASQLSTACKALRMTRAPCIRTRMVNGADACMHMPENKRDTAQMAVGSAVCMHACMHPRMANGTDTCVHMQASQQGTDTYGEQHWHERAHACTHVWRTALTRACLCVCTRKCTSERRS